jgi:LmbE family N-acetylglucosaminyl deacetylase
MNKFLNFNRVLCLSPHPDDIEYSMAGTILKHTDTHFDILCLTHGGDFDSTTINTDRIQEVKDAWHQSNVTNYTLHFSPYVYLKTMDIDGWVNYIETEFISKYNYDCIFTPSDADSHFEHKIVCSLGYPLTRISKISIIEYYSPSTLETWVPNVFIDITDHYDTKRKMLLQFKSQQHRSYFNPVTLLGFHTNFRCSKRKIDFVEQYRFKQVFL